MEQHLMEKACRVLVMALLGILQFLVLIKVPHCKNNFYVLGQGDTFGINNKL